MIQEELQAFQVVQGLTLGQNRHDRTRDGAKTSVALGLLGLSVMPLMALLLSGCGQKGPLTLPSAAPSAISSSTSTATPTPTTSTAPAPARAASTPTR